MGTATLARRTRTRVRCIRLGFIARRSASRGVGEECGREGSRREAGVAVAEAEPGLSRGLERRGAPVAREAPLYP